MSDQQIQQPPAPALKANHSTRNALIAGGAALAGLVGAVLVFGDRGGDEPAATFASTATTVVYQAEGAGTAAASYTLRSDDGGTRQGNADLPMKNQAGDIGLTFMSFTPGDFVYLSVQNQNGSGSVTCRILVNGTVISENTSSGGYKIATCSSSVPRS